MTTNSPLLGDSSRVDHAPHHATGAPVLHQRSSLLLGNALQSENPRVLQRIIHTRIVVSLIGVGLGDGSLARLARLELAKDELLRGVAESVVLGGGTNDGTAVGEGSLAGEGIDEHADQGKFVRVDLVEVGIPVLADLVDVSEAIKSEEHRRTAGKGEFGPEGQNCRPSVLGFLGAQGKVGESGALLQVGELGPILLELELLENDPVCPVDALDQLEAVRGLGELHRLGIGDRGVVRVSVGKFLAYTRLLATAMDSS